MEDNFTGRGRLCALVLGGERLRSARSGTRELSLKVGSIYTL